MAMRKTYLQQKRISNVSDSLKHFNSPDETTVPLVLVPDDRYICSCSMSVPSGPYCILHRFGKDIYPDELASPGLQFTPACNRIAYVVNAQACTYNAPVKSCPTADNVMVDCDLTLVFQIGPSPRDVKKFVYKLGARRFDDFLFAAVEEAIRHLIRTCLHTEVYELRGGSDDRVKETLHELNKKFNIFGCVFSSAAITDVRFKRELQDTLQQTTEFGSKIEEQAKRQKNLMDQIEFRKNREMQELEKQHSRIIQDLQAKRTRVEIDREKQTVEVIGRAEVACTKARQDASVEKLKAEAEKKVAKNQGLMKKEELMAETRARDQATRIKVDQETKTQCYEGEQRLIAAKAISDALATEASAEAAAAPALKVKREHDLRMAKMEVLQMMASNNKIVISGDAGDKLIEEMMSNVQGTMSLAQ
jgi:regulator of protease activity HflC (stomatin/prohibitin superfamily)